MHRVLIAALFIIVYTIGFKFFYSHYPIRLRKKHYEYYIVFLVILLIISILFKKEINMLP